MSHQEILEKILFEKKTSKRELARQLNYSEQNSSNTFNKPTYSEKMIKKISEALGVEASVFTIQAVGGDNHGIVTQTISASDRILELESRIRDKDELIAMLKNRIKDLEGRHFN